MAEEVGSPPSQEKFFSALFPGVIWDGIAAYAGVSVGLNVAHRLERPTLLLQEENNRQVTALANQLNGMSKARIALHEAGITDPKTFSVLDTASRTIQTQTETVQKQYPQVHEFRDAAVWGLLGGLVFLGVSMAVRYHLFKKKHANTTDDKVPPPLLSVVRNPISEKPAG